MLTYNQNGDILNSQTKKKPMIWRSTVSGKFSIGVLNKIAQTLHLYICNLAIHIISDDLRNFK